MKHKNQYTLKDEIIVEQVSIGKLNKMCKYFKIKKYIYNLTIETLWGIFGLIKLIQFMMILKYMR